MGRGHGRFYGISELTTENYEIARQDTRPPSLDLNSVAAGPYPQPDKSSLVTFCFSSIYFTSVLPIHLSRSLPSGFPTKISYISPTSSTRSIHFSLRDLFTIILSSEEE